MTDQQVIQSLIGRDGEWIVTPVFSYIRYESKGFWLIQNPKKQQFSNLKSLLKADREKEIAQYGKQVSMRPSKVHKSKKDYDRKKNKVQERDLE